MSRSPVYMVDSMLGPSTLKLRNTKVLISSVPTITPVTKKIKLIASLTFECRSKNEDSILSTMTQAALKRKW